MTFIKPNWHRSKMFNVMMPNKTVLFKLDKASEDTYTP